MVATWIEPQVRTSCPLRGASARRMAHRLRPPSRCAHTVHDTNGSNQFQERVTCANCGKVLFLHFYRELDAQDVTLRNRHGVIVHPGVAVPETVMVEKIVEVPCVIEKVVEVPRIVIQETVREVPVAVPVPVPIPFPCPTPAPTSSPARSMVSASS